MTKTNDRRQALSPCEADHALWMVNRGLAMLFAVALLAFILGAQ